jgi:hypothetical protein
LVGFNEHLWFVIPSLAAQVSLLPQPVPKTATAARDAAVESAGPAQAAPGSPTAADGSAQAAGAGDAAQAATTVAAACPTPATGRDLAVAEGCRQGSGRQRTRARGGPPPQALTLC